MEFTTVFAGDNAEQQQEEVAANDNNAIIEQNNRQENSSPGIPTDEDTLSSSSSSTDISEIPIDLRLGNLDNTYDESDESGKYLDSSSEDSLDFDPNEIKMPKIDETKLVTPIDQRIFHFVPNSPDMLVNRSPLIKTHNPIYKFNFDPYSEFPNPSQYYPRPNRLEMPKLLRKPTKCRPRHRKATE